MQTSSSTTRTVTESRAGHCQVPPGRTGRKGRKLSWRSCQWKPHTISDHECDSTLVAEATYSLRAGARFAPIAPQAHRARRDRARRDRRPNADGNRRGSPPTPGADDPGFVCEYKRLHPIAQAELVEDVSDMGL